MIDHHTDEDYRAAAVAPWSERVASYQKKDNVLWNLREAWRELLGLMDERHLHPLNGADNWASQIQRVQSLTPKELAELTHTATTTDRCPSLRIDLQDERSNFLHAREAGRFIDTGNPDVMAFQNIAYTNFPVRKLVIPANKPFMSFEHFVDESTDAQVGAYFRGVLKVARDSVRHFDANVSPEVAAKRAQYEQAFAQIRRHYRDSGALPKSGSPEAKIIEQYMQETGPVAVRDPRVGHSGYRLVINVTPGSATMSQPHFHTQILGGCCLQGRFKQMNDAQTYAQQSVGAGRSLSI